MQVFIKHWTDINLNSPAKHVNAPLIKELTGVENYKGRADQIDRMMTCITKENYSEMLQRVLLLECSDEVFGCSNFGRFLKFLESDDEGWIENINKLID